MFYNPSVVGVHPVSGHEEGEGGVGGLLHAQQHLHLSTAPPHKPCCLNQNLAHQAADKGQWEGGKGNKLWDVG